MKRAWIAAVALAVGLVAAPPDAGAQQFSVKPVAEKKIRQLPAGPLYWRVETLPSADLILAFAEHKGVAELLPDIAAMTGAAAVLAPVDNEAWLPRGLARQLVQDIARRLP